MEKKNAEENLKSAKETAFKWNAFDAFFLSFSLFLSGIQKEFKTWFRS